MERGVGKGVYGEERHTIDQVEHVARPRSPHGPAILQKQGGSDEAEFNPTADGTREQHPAVKRRPGKAGKGYTGPYFIQKKDRIKQRERESEGR